MPAFASEIKYLYLTRGKLRQVISHAKALMDGKGKGTDATMGNPGADGEVVEENPEMWNADAIGSLTVGAILSLRVSRHIEAAICRPCK